jgi:hypothetical protein
MQRLTALALILAMAVMGFAAATARGQSTAGGQVLVLCSGGGLVQVTLDADGKPTGDTHICPDLAFSLLAALEVSPPDVARPVAAISELPRVAVGVRRHGIAPVAERARGPPVRI